MRLIDRLTGGSPVQQRALSGQVMLPAWGDPSRERIGNAFQSYAAQGYAANSTVFSVVGARLDLLSQAEFKWQDPKTRKLFGNESLRILEEPWPNGTSADLIAAMEQHASLAGNAFVRRAPGRLVVMRPDWVDIVKIEVVEGRDELTGEPMVHKEVAGYLYSEGGIGIGDPVFYPVEDVAHWTPVPDPLKDFTGMSWMTPVLREIDADVSMTKHRRTFFENAGTPNLILRYKERLDPEQIDRIRDRWAARYGGPKGAGATVVLDEGADLSVVGSTFEQMQFDKIQAAGEARIASAAGVPAIVAGLQAGLDANAYNVYRTSIKAFVDGKGSALWQSLCASLAKLVDRPTPGTRLWWDTRNMPALREDEKDRAAAAQTFAAAASTLITAGFTPESVTNALSASDMTQLVHSGLVSVQLLQPGDVPDQKSQTDSGGTAKGSTNGN